MRQTLRQALVSIALAGVVVVLFIVPTGSYSVQIDVTITGRVVDATSGAAIGGARVFGSGSMGRLSDQEWRRSIERFFSEFSREIDAAASTPGAYGTSDGEGEIRAKLRVRIEGKRHLVSLPGDPGIPKAAGLEAVVVVAHGYEEALVRLPAGTWDLSRSDDGRSCAGRLDLGTVRMVRGAP